MGLFMALHPISYKTHMPKTLTNKKIIIKKKDNKFNILHKSHRIKKQIESTQNITCIHPISRFNHMGN